jgi:hypothetical protein
MKVTVAFAIAMSVTTLAAASSVRGSTLHEATRLAGLSQRPSAESDWSRVRKLKPGTAIVLVEKTDRRSNCGADPGVSGSSVQDRGHVIQTDDSTITVLNLICVVLPPDVRGALRDLAENRPELFLAAERGRRFVLPGGVWIGPAGVFLSGRKVADLGQVIDRVPRDAVLSIAMRRKRTRGSEAQVVQGAVGGFLLTMVGASGGGTGPNFCTEHRDGCWPVIGMGSMAGAGLAYLTGNGKTFVDDVVVYRAP